VNSSLIPQESERDDIRIICVPATDMAIQLGNARLLNVICLAALVTATGVVSLEAVKQALNDRLPARHRNLLGLNNEAIDQGAALVDDWLID
jgi:2-oxoglutarate ferredoxin oxidoreductase subunit gamma